MKKSIKIHPITKQKHDLKDKPDNIKDIALNSGLIALFIFTLMGIINIIPIFSSISTLSYSFWIIIPYILLFISIIILFISAQASIFHIWKKKMLPLALIEILILSSLFIASTEINKNIFMNDFSVPESIMKKYPGINGHVLADLIKSGIYSRYQEIKIKLAKKDESIDYQIPNYQYLSLKDNTLD